MFIHGTQVRVGMIIHLKGELYRITHAHHLTPGNKRGLIQTKLRNLRTGTQSDQRFRSDESLEKATLEEREMEYLYNGDGEYVFMDTETFEQLSLGSDVFGELQSYLTPNIRVMVEFYEGRPVGVELSGPVDLEVAATEPGLKKATATASLKPATLETGLVVQVPHFIEVGDKIRVDPSSGKYVERAK